VLGLVLTVLVSCHAPGSSETWNQFRGPNARGVPTDDTLKLPGDLDLELATWRTAIPSGHSSPVLDELRVYLTAVNGDKLETLAISRKKGNVIWRKTAKKNGDEEIHQIGSRAQSSVATDGQHVVSFFGSAGLACYDREGLLLWTKSMGPFKNSFGAASSPIIADGRVLLQQDHDEGSFVAAYDVHTGDEVWKTDRAEFPRGFATPIVWNDQLVCVGTLRVVGYSLADGNETWSVSGLGRIANVTPTIADDGNLIATVWAPGGDSTGRIDAPPFDEVIRENDKNENGSLEKSETPEGALRSRFGQIDRDKDAVITRAEYESMRDIFEKSQNKIVSIRPGGEGDITETHVAWTQRKFLPYVPSPVAYKGHVYVVKNQGILSSLDGKTGEVVKSGRLQGLGNYYASPVIADGKLYAVDQKGVLSVVQAEPEWTLISSVKFGEPVYATPAISDGAIYVRTSKNLYRFDKVDMKDLTID
ncbi:MAG: PQQ-binding-like beta-propeller repeat protein, partial [Planctomycetota bacterium]